MKSPLSHLLLMFVTAIAVCAGYVAWYAAVSEKSREVANLQRQIIVANETVGRIASARAALTEIAGDETKGRSYFVPETGVVAFINDLESRGLSPGASMDVASVSTGGSPVRPMLIFSLTIKGTFDAVMRTIGSIEYAPYDIQVSSISIGQETPDVWRASLSLKVGSISLKSATSTP